MDDRIKNIAFWIMFLIVIALCIFLFIFLRSQSNECLTNPLVYGVSEINNKIEIGEFMCTCYSPMTSTIYITKDGISFEDNKDNNLLLNRNT